jgi:quercetin dioxygenase-like cupin family protein
LRIYDNNNKLLAIYIKYNSSQDEKNFVTDDHFEFQVATFNLPKDTEILRHYHPEQKREINGTSEVIVVQEGTMSLDIYSDENTLVESIKLKKGDVVNMISGGHGIKIDDDCKFIEVKQGPYFDEIDKVRF